MNKKTQRETWDKIAILHAHSLSWGKEQELVYWAKEQGFFQDSEWGVRIGPDGRDALKFIKECVDDDTLELWKEELKFTKEQRIEMEKKSPELNRKAEERLKEAIKKAKSYLKEG